MVVLAIVALLVGIGAPSIFGTASAGRLNQAGNQVVALVNEARQNSISHHVMTALILVTPGSEGGADPTIDNRLFVIAELGPGSDGKPGW